MFADIRKCGLDVSLFEKFVEEAVYSLPGVEQSRQDISVYITGSRGAGLHQADSDVNVDVVCTKAVFERIGHQCFEAGIVKSRESLFVTIDPDSVGGYFGQKVAKAGFSIMRLDTLEKQLSEYNDEWMWIWQNAVRFVDPGVRVESLVEKYRFYPQDVLVRKIKYHWLKVGYWLVEVYPYTRNQESRPDILSAVTAIVNSFQELMRFFLLTEDRCFPYVKHLSRVAGSTRLGGKYCSLFKQYCSTLLNGKTDNAWERLDEVCEQLCCCDKSAEALALWEHCGNSMIAAGVSKEWVDADYDNINELLMGLLG